MDKTQFIWSIITDLIMTVVVGILNKRGVSIAADSATTHAVTHKLPNGDEVAVIDHVYRCRAWCGALRPQAEEVRELRWFPWDGLPEELMPSAKPALRDWLALKRREEQT